MVEHRRGVDRLAANWRLITKGSTEKVRRGAEDMVKIVDSPDQGNRSSSSVQSSTEDAGVGGSNPSPLTTFLNWLKGEPIGLPECPYSYRWKISFGFFSIRLHKWIKSDDDRVFHDHPYWFITLVLRGGYKDISPKGTDFLSLGSIRYRPAEHQHTVQLTKSPTYTLLLAGRPSRRWGFWVDGKIVKRDRYFAVWGHHACDEGGLPIRRRPDGSRI